MPRNDGHPANWPSHESEAQHRQTTSDQWEFGFYEPPSEKIPRDRLTLREAVVLLKTKSDLDQAGTSETQTDNAHRILNEYPAVKRLSEGTIDQLWRYFRPFERSDEQKIVRKATVRKLYDRMHGFVDEIDVMETIKDALRLNEDFKQLNSAEQKQFLEAVMEQRKLEHERLETRLRQMRDEEEEKPNRSLGEDKGKLSDGAMEVESLSERVDKGEKKDKT